jgi:hypothetical protein
MTIHILIRERAGSDSDPILEDFVVHPLPSQTDDEIAAIIKNIIANRWDTDE